MHSPRWIDRHFWSVVPPLAILGSIAWAYELATALSTGLAFIPRICGAFACYLWADYLRKDGLVLWFFLGLIPLLPELYLLGWHRAVLRQQRQTSPPPADCPRCGFSLPPSTPLHCPNCSWTSDDA